MQFYEQALVKYNEYADTPKKKNYFEIVATLLLLIALVVMIYPAITHIIELNSEIAAGKVVEQSLNKKIIDLETAKANLAAVQKDLPLLELALPTGSDIKTFIKKPLEDISSKHNMVITSVQFGNLPISIPSSNVNLIPRNMDFSITLSGTFVNFEDFLKDIEKFIRVTDMTNINIKTNGTTISATLQATTNYLGEPLTVSNQAGGQ